MISIIIPYKYSNDEYRLKKTLNSIISQKTLPKEVIIISNESETIKEKLNSFFNGNVNRPQIQLCNFNDKGIYDAINHGIHKSKCDWVNILGAGDTFKNDLTLQNIHNLLNNEYDLIYGDVFHTNKNQRYCGEITLDKLLNSHNIDQQSIFYNRNIFKKIGFFDVAYEVLADWDFNIRCFKNPYFKKLWIDEIVATRDELEGRSGKEHDCLFKKELPIYHHLELIKLENKKNEEISELNLIINNKNQILLKQNQEINDLNLSINHIHKSFSWKFTKIFRVIKILFLWIKNLILGKSSYGEIKKDLKIKLVSNQLISQDNKIIFFQKKKVSTSNSLPKLLKEPKISIIIINHNGGELLDKTIDSVLKSYYKNFEIIIYDNNSQLKPTELSKKDKRIRVICGDKNLGFAGGNNLAYRSTNSDLIFFLNNDVIIQKDTISQMVSAITSKDTIAAVSPKIIFYEPFFELELILLKEKVIIDVVLLKKKLAKYPKYFIIGDHAYENNHLVLEKNVLLRLPLSILEEDFCLNEITKDEVEIKINDKIYSSSFKINKIKNHINYFNVINNAGSKHNEEFDCQDIGFGEIDNGQYDKEMKCSLLCGCAFMFKRDALQYNELPFNDSFFAYFEDSDLSVRLIKKGYDLVYTPSTFIRHAHSSTFGEKSIFFNFYVKRNSLIFKYLHHKNKSQIKKKISNEITSFEDNFKDLLEDKDFKSSLNGIIESIDSGVYFQKQLFNQNLVIYNEYWYTHGGGEHRALMLAKQFENKYNIILVSTTNFNIDSLLINFNLNFKNIFKKICNDPSEIEEITKSCQIFINTTHNSDLLSHCSQSLYLISFPELMLSKKTLASYQFYSNSEFTKLHVKKNWNIDSKVLYPFVPKLAKYPVQKDNYEINILNVGRFFKGHHSKKQKIIIKIFKKIKEKYSNKKINLFLVGNVNFINEVSREYFYECASLAGDDVNISLIPNATFEKIISLYEKSHIYIHATGLNEKDPAKYEHFGISVVEACQFECIPLVYSEGGPKEIINDIDLLFSSEDELIEKLEFLIHKQGDKKFLDLKKQHIKNQIEKFSNSELLFKSI